MIKKIIIFLSLFSFVFADKGYEIASNANMKTRNFIDEKSKSTLIMINATNDTIVRNMNTIIKKKDEFSNYSVIQFLNPPDVRGTALLTHQSTISDDQQWLYLPRLKRVKKMASKNKSGAFMGSEFTYEDIGGNSVDKWSYSFIEEISFNNQVCFIIEKKPKYQNSGYTKIKEWISKENYHLLRSEYFDRKNSLLKVQTISEWKKYGKVWRSDIIVMDNVQTGKKSILTYGKRIFNSGITINQFSRSAMKRLIKI